MGVQIVTPGASAGTAKLTKREITWSSGNPTAVVETYSDGTVNTRTYTYDSTTVPPRLTKVVDTAPPRTEDITYNADGTVQKVTVS